ncbi:hypothetical protein B0H15DRAFT_958216 [Mycena belliarum]|uniref:DUF6534 domain-containing protein n=1 Tax=Mycena belliarum TaxID=1033014 RepID=A0AAD6XFV7_9AGAR|nr:hypothetical protein B0H15DRAFT_958216 [Mycena belliae]
MIAYGVDTPLILGVMEIGVFLSLVMFGVVALQGYVYFNNCHSDRAGIKLLVGSVLFFELCHSVASCHVIYYFTVALAGVPELEKPANSYSLSLTPLFETIITALVQGFFAYRIYLLSGRLSLSLICWMLCLLRLIGGIAVAVESFLDVPIQPNYFHLQDTYGWVITSALSVGAVSDLLIAAALCFYIRQFYTPYNLPKSEELITRLIVWTIETGLITSIMSAAVMISFQTMKHNFIWIALYTFLAKLYSNSLLVSLNARPKNRDMVRPPFPKFWDATPLSTPPRTPLSISITKTTHLDSAVSFVEPLPGLLQVPGKAKYSYNTTHSAHTLV